MVSQTPIRSTNIPHLESGDRLTRAEFERRYKVTPEGFKAELVEGVVYVASPVRVLHGNPHFKLITWLGVYSTATPGLSGSDNATTRLDLDNEPQPDVLLRLDHGGTSTISADGYVEGAPELVAEIATSSSAIDLGDKKKRLSPQRRPRILSLANLREPIELVPIRGRSLCRDRPRRRRHHPQHHLSRTMARRHSPTRWANDDSTQHPTSWPHHPRTSGLCPGFSRKIPGLTCVSIIGNGGGPSICQS